MTLFNLQNRVAFITGGSGGIGLGMAKGFASSGAAVVIAGRNQTKAQSALAELHSLGAQAEFVELDVLAEASCYRAIARAVERFGRLDILVNNAGTSIRKAPEELTAHDWHSVMNTNLTSAFLCSQAAYPYMRRADGGKIVNIGSMMSIFGMPFATAYAASKGGIVQMTRAIATAWAKDNIQVQRHLARGSTRTIQKKFFQSIEIAGLDAALENCAHALSTRRVNPDFGGNPRLRHLRNRQQKRLSVHARS